MNFVTLRDQTSLFQAFSPLRDISGTVGRVESFFKDEDKKAELLEASEKKEHVQFPVYLHVLVFFSFACRQISSAFHATCLCLSSFLDGVEFLLDKQDAAVCV